MDTKIDKLIANFVAIKEELAKNVNASYSPPGNAMAMAEVEKREHAFKKLQAKLEREGKSKESAGAIAHKIGVESIGQAEMTARSKAARKSDDKEDVKLAEEIEDKVMEHVKRNKKDEKKEGHKWMAKKSEENLRCSEHGQWKLDKANTKNPCQCHDCVQFGLSKHPEPKPEPIKPKK